MYSRIQFTSSSLSSRFEQIIKELFLFSLIRFFNDQKNAPQKPVRIHPWAYHLPGLPQNNKNIDEKIGTKQHIQTGACYASIFFLLVGSVFHTARFFFFFAVVLDGCFWRNRLPLSNWSLFSTHIFYYYSAHSNGVTRIIDHGMRRNYHHT